MTNTTDPNKRAREFDAPLSAIIKALVKIVESPQTDAQHDADVIPRDHVMEQVTRIREAWDKISSLARALSHAPAAAAGGEARVTDGMVDAYLAAQAKAVQAVDDKWGAGGKAASYLHPVREACRAGLEAALAAALKEEK